MQAKEIIVQNTIFKTIVVSLPVFGQHNVSEIQRNQFKGTDDLEKNSGQQREMVLETLGMLELLLYNLTHKM